MEDLPLVSLVILTYKQRGFVDETVSGALTQDYPNLQIVFTDDNSPDGTFERIEELVKDYKGPHKIVLNKNTVNLGLVGQVNRAIGELSSGEYIMLSGGDDCLLPYAISTAVSFVSKSGVASASFNMIKMNAASSCYGLYFTDNSRPCEIFSITDYILGKHKSSGACRIFKREIFNVFGPLMKDCPTEDSTNLLRTFLTGKVGFCAEPVIKYRVLASSLSGFNSLMTRMDPQKIHAQYHKDLNLALEKGLISNDDYQALKCKFEEKLNKSLAERKVYAQKNLFARMMVALSYLHEKDFGIHGAKELVLHAIGWSKAGL